MLVRRAAVAQPSWAALGVAGRLRVVAHARVLLLERMDEVAALIASETGKTIVEALPMEITPMVDTCRWLEGNAARHLRPIDAGTPQLILAGRRHGIRLEPYGVVGVISPWNYPMAVASGSLLFNLVAGNAVVWKPSSNVPLVGEAIRRILEDAGLPDDILTVVQGGPAVGEALVTAPGIEKVFFTGSEAVGRHVMTLAANAPGHPRPVVLELGGKDAMLVLWDADLVRAASGAAWAGFGHSGQTCGAARRIYVDARVADRFVSLLVERARRIVPGDPMDPASQMGAMAHATTRDTVSELVRRRDRAGRHAPRGRAGLHASRRRGPRGRGTPACDDPRGGARGRAALARGAVRAGARGRAVHDRGRGDPARERLAVRAVRVGVVARHRAGGVARGTARRRRPSS